MKSRVFEYLAEAVRSPSEKLSRGQQFVRQSWELAVYCWRQLQFHRAEGMAAELTYRTVFALIPVVVLGLVMFRIFGGLDEVQNKVEYQLYSFFGVPEIPDDTYVSPATLEKSQQSEDATITLNATQSDDPGGTQMMTSADEPTSADQDADAAVEDATDSDSDRTSDEASTEAPVRLGDQEEADRVAGGAAQTQPAPQTKPRAEAEPAEAETAEEAAARDEAERQQSQREAQASIRRKLHEVTSMVSNIDFRSIGVFGLLLFIYAAVALADATEHLFNRIYDAPSQRPVHLRIAIHWSIITLGSGLLAMSLYMSGQVIEWSGTVGANSTIRWILSHGLSILFAWVLLFLLYALMPNTHVSVRAAMIGSLVGSLLWEAAKFGFQIYVVKAVPYSNIYGSIGLIPLFLFWIYVTWLIVLFGLILTYTLQTFGGRLPRKLRDRRGVLLHGDPDWMLPIMCEVGRAFDEGKPIPQQKLADQIGLSSREVREMTEQLIEANMLRRVAGEEDSLTLARPAERIQIVDILNLAHHVRPTNDHPAWKTLANLKQAERDAALGKTLADLVT